MVHRSFAPRVGTAALLLKLAGVLATFAGCEAARAPDTIFFGTFVTLVASPSEVEALAVTDGVIVGAGSRQEIEARAGDATILVEIEGVAVPGFVDGHVHVSGLGALLEQLNVQAMPKEAVLAAVAEAARATPAGEWITGGGWDEGFFAVETYPHAADLDAVSPGHPVFLSRIDGHSAWVNTRALRLAGITERTTDPPRGRILRDGTGAPTGMLLETAQDLVRRAIPDTETPEVLERRIRSALDQYARWGLTGVHDAGTTLPEIEIFEKLLASGELPVRVYAMARGDEAVAHYLGSGPRIGLGDDRLTIRSFKIMLDGALGARGAELSEPYSDAPETGGLRQMEDEEVDRFIAAARAKGFQVAAHVIGDLGVERALDAVDRNGLGPSDRFRLEHASMISPPNLTRFADRGVIASMQPVFIGEYSRWGEDRVGPSRAPWLLPIGDLLETGAVLAAGTDYPASDSGDPRATLAGLVARTGFDGKPEGGWFPDQAVDVETALRSMSAGNAYAAFQEDRLGSLTVGRYADFTVLASDPRRAAAEELLRLPVTMTVVGGRAVYRKTKE